MRFRAGGGRPPASHEVLLIAGSGEAWYLAGMPWPEQEPFDEVGTYRITPAPEETAWLTRLADAAVAAGAETQGPADAGTERVRTAAGEVRWSPEDRPAPASALVTAARAVITAAREHPVAVVRAALRGDALELTNAGEQAVAVGPGEAHPGDGGSPLRLAAADPVALCLPPRLEPHRPVTVRLPAAPAAVAVHVPFRPALEGEGEWVDGWLLATAPRS